MAYSYEEQDTSDGNQSKHIKWEIVQYTRGRVLDIGCGRFKPFDHFVGLDNNQDNEIFGIYCKPDIFIKDAGDLSLFGSENWDAVFSSHMLEHVPYEKVPDYLKEWWRVIKPNGYLVLYLPDEDQYPVVGHKWANPDHKWNVNYERVRQAMLTIKGWDLVDFQKRTEGHEFSLFFVFQKHKGDKHRYSWEIPLRQPRAAVVRYGGFGDMLQASSVFAGLKQQGYYVDVYTTPQAMDICKADPNIDRFILQDTDQVPNRELYQFWEHHRKKYERWINLSESVEASLIAIPSRTPHAWSPIARHKLVNRNYLENQHDMAKLPHKPQVAFFPTPLEVEWRKKVRAKMGSFVVMWALAGSSVHKTWPYMDNVIAALLLAYDDIHIVLSGGPDGKILEAGWEKEPRVHCTSSEWSIRESLAFAQIADVVIGPETGVLNSVSQLKLPKIIFLSHSTIENLTRDWVNTYSLWAENVTCKGRGNNEAPACHQMHYGWDFCTKDYDENCEACKAKECSVHTYTAVCQSAIKPDRVLDIMYRLVDERLQKAA